MLRLLSVTAGDALLENRAGGLLNYEQRRQVAFAGTVEELHILTRTLGPKQHRERKLWPNCTVHPSNSRTRRSFLRDAFRIASQLIEHNQINIVSVRDPFTFGLLGARLKRAHGVGLAVHVMADMIDNPYFVRERLRNRLFNAAAKRVLRHADAVRVSTTREKTKLNLMTPRLGLLPEQVHRVPFLVECEALLEADGRLVRREYSGGQRRPIVLFVGRLARQKDVSTLVRAIALVAERIPEVLLLIVGDGTERVRLKHLVERLGLRRHVALTGHVDHDELPGYYGACDVFAITSLYEGTCMALVEAAAAGRPVVTTDFAGAHDAVVDGQSGFIVPIGNELAVAERILHVLECNEREEIGHRGREHVRAAFDRRKILVGTRALWDATLEQHRKSRHGKPAGG